MAQQQRYSRCSQCDTITLQVRGSAHEVPHIPHVIAAVALMYFGGPAIGLAWCVVWAIHAAGNTSFGGKWNCTECGAILD